MVTLPQGTMWETNMVTLPQGTMWESNMVTLHQGTMWESNMANMVSDLISDSVTYKAGLGPAKNVAL